MSTMDPTSGMNRGGGSDRGPGADLAGIRRRLRTICVRLRAILIARGVLESLALLIALAIGVALIDYLLRLPTGVRVLAWLGLLGLAVRQWISDIAPAVRVRPSPTDIALTLERHDPALRGLLAGAIDLDLSESGPRPGELADDDERIGHSLTTAALSTARRRLGGLNPRGVLRLGELARAAVLFAIVAAFVLATAIASPQTAITGAKRVLSPWADASWPKRYAITDTTATDPRPLDVAVPIRALIGTEQTGDTQGARATVSWRLLDADRSAVNDWSRTMLVPQRRRDQATGIPVYEQLIDAQAAAARHADSSFTLEYRITTGDDATATRRIPLVRPPELRQTTIDIELPEYARPIAERELVRSGQTVSEREDMIVSPVLAGSRVEFVWRFSKPVAAGEGTPDWVAGLGEDNDIVLFDQPTPDSMRLVIRAGSSTAIEPAVIDASGIPVRTPIVVSLGVLGDRAPGAAITQPPRDEVISSHAVLELAAELTDDLGLSRGRIHAVRASPPDGSAGAPPEPVDAGRALTGRDFDADQRVTLTHTLDVSTLEVAPGDQLWISAIAWDLRSTGSDEDTGMTRSPERVLRVVADSELIEQVHQGLNPVRSALRRLDEQQSELQQMLRDGNEHTAREQRALTGRIEANARAIEQLRRTVERNNLDDDALRSMLGGAGGALGEAAEASERAGEQIDRGSDDQARENQERVRDRLGDLLSMLDRGQDSWMALRSVQQLRDELESLRADTNELSARTAGKTLDQLSPEDRGALEQILERQLQNAEDAAEAMNALDERAQQLQEQDPTQAEALRRAAQQGRSAQMEQKLREAAEQLGENQTASAGQTQEEVLEELEHMLDELENTIRNRDNALRRELASIIEAIEGLISAQENEIRRLDAAINAPDEPIDGTLDDRLITLVGNTLSVRDEALGAFPETRTIADLIKQAADAQNGAINALRQSPPALADAARFEQAGLLHLTSALEEAKRVDDQAAQRQARRLREELRQAYREALDEQTGVRDETAPLIGEALTRRQRAHARTIALGQEAIRAGLDELLARTEELGDAPIFSLAHDQLDRLMTRSAEGLSGAEVGRGVLTAQNGALTVLASLVEVLGEESPDQQQDDFEDGSSSGGGQGGGQGGGDEPVIPPMAELRLLRTMQQLAADQTRSVADDPDSADASTVRAISDLQRRLFEQGAKLIESMNPQQAPPVQNGGDMPSGGDGGGNGDAGGDPSGPMNEGDQ